MGGRPDRGAGAGKEHSWIHDLQWDPDPWENIELDLRPAQEANLDPEPDSDSSPGPEPDPDSPTHPGAASDPPAPDPAALFRATPSGRTSPILIPGEPTSSPLGRARKWIARLLATESKVGSRPTEEESKDLEPADPDLAADHGVGNHLRDRGSPAPARDQPIHRATTQMLPGRLHPLNPEAVEQEVRFLRDTIPRDTFKVTLGWDLGSPPEHVTLDHPSIQPLHAKMTYQNGQWSIETLADAYPVEINETVRLDVGVSYLLSDGDEIRIGKALFRFSYP